MGIIRNSRNKTQDHKDFRNWHLYTAQKWKKQMCLIFFKKTAKHEKWSVNEWLKRMTDIFEKESKQNFYKLKMQLLKLREPMNALNKRIDSTAERISELEINF